MQRVKLTDRLVKGLALPESGNEITYCGELKGFGIRATAKGAKSFILNYRFQGRERRATIGAYPAWSVNAARDQAAHMKRQLDLGNDPLAERDAQKSAPNVQDLFQRYDREHLPKKAERSAKDDRSMWRNYILPKLGKVRVANLTYAEIDNLHRFVSIEKPVRANRILEVLRKALNLAIQWGWINDNPAVGVSKNREAERERYLSHIELDKLSHALIHCKEKTSADAIRMLLFTGARKGEVLSAEWKEFDLISGHWTKPSHHTKQKRVHRIPLSEPAVELLRSVKAENFSDKFVFPGKVSDQPLTDIKKTWHFVRELATALLWQEEKMAKPVKELGQKVANGEITFSEATKLAEKMGLKTPVGLTDVRPHDLRHTYASVLVGQGVSLPIVGALLGHTQAQTTMRYAHLADDPLRAATEIVGQTVSPRGIK